MRNDVLTILDAPGGSVGVRFPYNPGALARFKITVPANQRRWDPAAKQWFVRATPTNVDFLVELASDFGWPVNNLVTGNGTAAPVGGRQGIKVMYLGNVRQRGDEAWATGMDAAGDWSFIFPWPVLSAFVGIRPDPRRESDPWSVLGVKPTATAQEIKKAYRALARAWHPDVSDHPEASDVFRYITEQYNLLNDERAAKKARMALALALAGSQSSASATDVLWTPPAAMRCGLVDAEIEESIGRMRVIDIYSWNPIVVQGKTLHAEWVNGQVETSWR